VRIAKADLVPTEGNLLTDTSPSSTWRRRVRRSAREVRRHRAGQRPHPPGDRPDAPDEALLAERERLHPLPLRPFTAALGETRSVNSDHTIRFRSVRYSTPPGLVGHEVWVRADGEEPVIVGDTDSGVAKVARHRLSTPVNPRIDLAPYPNHPQTPDDGPRPPKPRASSRAEATFLALGPGAHSWLVEAASAARSECGRR
jgi:hypothetical protein